ncbi:mismatch repair ATPase (MutS family) [Desulfosporosinus orientis DSM 765]|uniref:Mismatch repair ATPase (MutS family) n=1 Tax=Desulfosporosinus orientis (strain ATCC 19365 / DSM 765 / NCIMB 8382 / VKM B-1628 / Singapore I) TaxID=768706 RepID=G7WDZ3_DESOD|nr:DNA mismatch repair protein [Desulfosporosinus orientis]AET69391.1 mismatch repair ATPase (MutS family) [Desulfosporosinus orientis DSM 765]
MNGLKERYEKRKEFYAQQAGELHRRINRLSNIRLGLSLVGLSLGVFFYIIYSRSLGIGMVLLTVILFIGLVFWHQSLRRKHLYRQILFENYAQSLQRLAGEWKSFPDKGEDFKNADHPFSEDLDLFGLNSLFQWINTAKTFRGRETLKEWLTAGPSEGEKILSRQEAVRELSKNLSWRQRFLAEACMAKGLMSSPQGIIQWAKTYDESYLRLRVLILARALPIVTISFLLIYLLTGKLSFWYPLLGIIIQSLILFAGKQRGKALKAVYPYKESIKIYEKMLARIERRSFQAEYLQDLKEGLPNREGTPAFQQIKKLAAITDMIANRDNAIFLIVNILTLWDIQCMIALESWKEKSGRFLGRWLETIAEFEALSSLAGIHYDHPDWTFPEINPAESGIRAVRMGHPLLRGAVCNDLTIDKHSGILLITGSNMSGKSTLLRTVGINLVLAYAGAPVYARSFSCSRLQLYSCMQVSDNLGESISSFYAELLRIKQIVLATKEQGNIFFLLDEIFKGTNSQDRHLGAKILIRQLSKAGAMGMVSTHDLELGDMEKESRGGIRNFHFREYYENDEIHFDYKLRLGISTTRNAMYLIKMAGIEVEGV